jgi:hypothetical protein
MRPLLHKIKPASGVAPLLHGLLRLALPLIVFVFSSLSIGMWLPMFVVLLSKWRIFAVRPRFWPANLRANSIDIMVGVSIVIFMAQTDSIGVRLLWALVYGIWLVFIKPKSGNLPVSVQAGLGQLAGLSAIFAAWPSAPLAALLLLVGLICYLSARHFFDSYNEPYARMLAYLWGYFGAALTWVLGHLLVVYPKSNGVVAQPTLFLTIIGYTLAAIYYLEHFDKLSQVIKRELLFICGGAVLLLIIFLYREGVHLIV